MHELKYKLCPRWLGWTLVVVGYALFGGAVWAWQSGREGLGLTLLVAGGIYLVAVVAAAVVVILVKRPWRTPSGEGHPEPLDSAQGQPGEGSQSEIPRSRSE